MLDLYHATRDDLIRIILRQRDTIADLERQIATLSVTQDELRHAIRQVTAARGATREHPTDDDVPPRGTPKGMPGLKPTEAAPATDRPRKKRTTGYGRHRMQATAEVVHALRVCPDCGAPLAGGSITRTREVIELPVPQIVVTEHVSLARRCPDCGKRCVPNPELDGVVDGQRRIGHGLSSLIAVLREEMRLPFAQIQRLLDILTGLHLSVGGLVDTVAHVAARATPVVDQLEATIRGSPVVHVDETGWREDGHNGYVWTFSTSDTRLFRHGSRAKTMLTDVLGEVIAPIVVSDFYGVYTGNDNVHQFCWAHLLRDIHDLTDQHPAAAAVQGWATAVHGVFTQAQTGATGSQTDRWKVRTQADLRRLCEPWLEPDVPQTKLCRRILRYVESLFVFVTEPAVPPTNNAAERSLRPLVISRKVSGGTRSDAGTQTKMTLASLFGTWRAQGMNPYHACRDLLVSPQV